MMEYITYEMFGAVGDGQTCDMPAIVKAHEEANRQGLPVRAKEGAVYYISPKALTAQISTSTDWTGARFIIDDRGCEDRTASIFRVIPKEDENLPLSISSLARGQSELANPYRRDLYVRVRNSNHLDYIRKGLNQDNGAPRADAFILRADGSLSSPAAFDFDEVTSVTARPIDQATVTLTGGEFTTIANQEESRYNYHSRNISIRRSSVEISGITHLITGELDHGAPYSGFIEVAECANVFIHDCLFTAHRTYMTIGSAGLPVPMGSYDLGLNSSCNVTVARCSQTTDIHDNRYWGLIGSNFCRDLLLEDCNFSRFDAHMGVTNCTLRRCRLGWQCLNAIGNGTFLIEDTDAYGRAFVNLREDYGCTWRGKIILRNCTWHPLTEKRAVFAAQNDGTHDFGYDCYLPEVEIDGLSIVEDRADDRPLFIFNDYIGDEPQGEQPYLPIPPKEVSVRNIMTVRPVQLCEKPSLMPETEFIR